MRSWLLIGLAGCRQLAGLDDLPAPDAPPAEIVPSNQITRDRETASLPTIRISDITTFDTDTGQVTGALIRAPGEGVVGPIGYRHAEFGGTELGVFAMSRLDVTPAGVLRLQGARAAVFLVETDATIEGTIDGTGGCADPAQRSCAGPGGGAGGTLARAATGCSPGQAGTTHGPSGADSGGGGGGAGFAGAAGGDATVGSTTYAGGAAAPRCMTSELEPLLGGSGGGGGGKGATPQGAAGGGGGGALQLTAFGSITITGLITMAGAGGEGGGMATNNGGAGAGGGGGGSILLEAPTLIVTGTLAANGGGGGGASSSSAAGQPGQSGIAKSTAASGGAGAGGSGGALDQSAQPGASMTNGNAGGGGGGAGRIFLRANAPAITGATISPAPGLGALRLR